MRDRHYFRAWDEARSKMIYGGGEPTPEQIEALAERYRRESGELAQGEDNAARPPLPPTAGRPVSEDWRF